jgi:hypothetical protein
LFPGFTPERHHTHGAAVKEFDALDVWRANQAAVERVGPAMILATQDVFAATAQSDRAGAMAANVAEGAQSTFLVTNDNDWFTGYVGGEKTFWIGDGALHTIYFSAGLAERSNELPSALESAGLLDLQNCRISVKARGERSRTLDLFVNVEVERFGQHKKKFKVQSQRVLLTFVSAPVGHLRLHWRDLVDGKAGTSSRTPS